MEAWEKELVARAQQGDRKAFTRLVIEHQNRVYSYLYRMLGNAYEAEEVAQEVFIAAFRFIAGFRGEGSLCTWLLRIASNMYKNRIRYNVRRKRSMESCIDDKVEQPDYRPIGERPENPEALLATQQMENALHEAISRLPEDFREVLVLRDIELLSYEQIQELTGLAEGTVKSRIHRARSQLARLMSGHLDGEELV
ncbi:MAG: sigma-70 family RNA polymerase sigma factor [Deltaproteobacteria bacterium]|nr:sigma-70 family RNA polymerase sigma factor [Deltaproteobacteria bacterium]